MLFLVLPTAAYADLTDIKFGQYQIADSQWNVSACLNTTTCQIYSKNPGTMYKIPWTSGMWTWQPGQYVQFTLSGNGSYPYTANVYNSNGTLAGTVGTGKIVNMGPDYFFFVGTDNNTGQLFSGSLGMSGTGGVTWTGTLNPTIEQANAYADANYSTQPLASGQTATETPSSSSSPPPPEFCCGGSSAPFSANAGFTSRASSWLANPTGDNAVTITQIGNYNTTTVTQTGRKNYAEVNTTGSSNTANVTQSSNSSTQLNYIEASINGNNNSTTFTQQSTGGGKGIYATVDNNSNSVQIEQKDSGGHYAEINLSGSNKTVNILQQGSASHMTSITLDGGATSISTTQSGSTNQSYSITHTCANASCGPITVTQGQ